MLTNAFAEFWCSKLFWKFNNIFTFEGQVILRSHKYRRTTIFALYRQILYISSARSTLQAVWYIWYTSQKRANCNKSVDISQQLVSTSLYQDAFTWLATACCWQQTYCKLIDCVSLLATSLLQVVSTSCNKSAWNDKLQQTWFWQAFCNLINW